MHVKRFADAQAYEAPNHRGVIGLQLQGFEPGGPTHGWVGFSQYLPGGGAIHHIALNTGNEDNQLKLRAHIEGLGFTDISEQKDRNYFKSCYVRTPSGALFEIAWTAPAEMMAGQETANFSL